MSDALPRLRDLESFPVREQGETKFALRDVHNIQERTMVLSAPAYWIAIQLDGRKSKVDIQAEFARQFEGQILPSDVVDRVVKVLDENFLLETARYRERMRAIASGYRKEDTRKAAHAGAVYSEDRAELHKEIREHFNSKDGPGLLEPPEGGTVRGLVAPHIDFMRGGPSYAWSYRELLGRPMADLYVLLGVAHVSPPTPFVLTDKDYQTPLGPARADAALARRLAEKVPFDPFQFEIVHRSEHSLEFQAVYLKWVAEQRKEDFKILPVLCSGVEEGEANTEAFLDALRAELEAYDGTVCLLAAVDLAHIGRRFGDDFDIDDARLAAMEKADRVSIGALEKLDAGAFYRSVVRRGVNERKVCGLGALYAFARGLKDLAPSAAAKTLRYAHAPDPAGGEVSFVSMSFVDA